MKSTRILEWTFRLVLAGAFLKAGYEKAQDPIQFLFDIRSFHLVPDPYAGLLSLGLPWLELLCALGVLAKRLYAGSLAVLAGSLAVFMAAIAWSWRRGLDISCGCFGKSDFEMTYTQHLLMNATLLGMALWLLWRESRTVRLQAPA
jgi:putative oxidoreductase